MLCAVCLSMFQNAAKAGLHHTHIQTVQSAADSGCRICITLCESDSLQASFPLGYRFKWNLGWAAHWDIFFYKSANVRRLGDLSVDEYDQVKTRVVYVQVATGDAPKGYTSFLKVLSDDLKSRPGAVYRDFPPVRDIPNSTGHQDVMQLARRWLDNCKNYHKCDQLSALREPRWYPSRLVQVGAYGQNPRLVLRDGTLDGPYAALSHCWGGAADFLMLSADIMADLQQQIPFASLPLSFQDAIVACRYLRIPYLWIDSLCILQKGDGSHEDWLAHANEMHRIYTNCELNIALDVAPNPHAGAFRHRRTEHLQDCVVWTPHHSPKPRKAWNLDEVSDDSSDEEVVQQQSATPQMNMCAIFSRHDFSFSRANLPLNKRAWVLQEKLMSPRTLHFQTDRIFWECEKCPTLSEYLPNGLGTQVFDCLHRTAYNITMPFEEHERRFGFYNYVTQFADRQLSHPHEDKLIAFSAIARTCEAWVGAAYRAGIFWQSMPWGLIWRAAPEGPSKRPPYRAPSWSWASVDARVYFDPQPYATMTDMTVADDVSVDLIDPANIFGQVKSAWLKVTGPLLSTHTLRNSYSEGGTGDFPGFKRTHFFSKHHFRVDWDELGEQPAREQEGRWAQARLASRDDVYLLAIGELRYPKKLAHDSATHGLILEPVDSETYRRAGTWEANVGFVEEYMGNARLQPTTIRIV